VILKAQQDQINDRVDRLDKKMDDIAKCKDDEFRSNIKAFVRSEVEEVDKVRVDRGDETMERVIEMRFEDMREEDAERERRKDNILLFNVKESESAVPEVRKDYDTRIVREVLESGLEVRDIEFTNVVRLGVFNEEATNRKPRPVRIKVISKDHRSTIFRNAKKLRNFEGSPTYFKDVFIANDKTPQERERDKLARVELKRRQDNGESNLYLRRGRIVEGRGRPKGSSQNVNDHPLGRGRELVTRR